MEATPGFEPTLKVVTRELGDAITGLGLSMSYDIVTQQHGGSITVESKPGSFTEFTVRLPRQ
jgi:signal transduction histidine kinase